MTVPQWDWYDYSKVRLLHFFSTVTPLRSFHNWTVAIVPQWHCYDCSTVTLLHLYHSGTVTIVPQWHCCDLSIVALLRLFYGYTVTTVPQWHFCDCSTVELFRLFHRDTVTIVPHWHCCHCSTVRTLRYKLYGLLTFFHSEIHCWRIITCTGNTTYDLSNNTLIVYNDFSHNGYKVWFAVTSLKYRWELLLW